LSTYLDNILCRDLRASAFTMDGWTEVAKKPVCKKKHLYSELEAQRLEKLADCRYLALMLRSPEVEGLFADGWEYAGVRKSDDVPDPGYAYKSIAVKDNPWLDSLLLLRREARSDTR